jgi:hypothetical protein
VGWEKSGELRRWRFTNLFQKGDSYYSIDGIDWKYWGYLESQIREMDDFLNNKRSWLLDSREKSIRCPIHYEKDGKLDLYDETKPDSSYAIGLERIKAANQKKREEYELSKKTALQVEAKKNQLIGIIPQKKLEAANYIENWRKSYQLIASLPQLYIAA